MKLCHRRCRIEPVCDSNDNRRPAAHAWVLQEQWMLKIKDLTGSHRPGEVSQKVGRKWRKFRRAGSESRTVGGDLEEDCFTLTRTGIGGTVIAVFGVKKEILVTMVFDYDCELIARFVQ
jgi:hypothetical protein